MKSIMQSGDKCFACGMAYGTEEHHVFPGNPNRRHSEEDGLKVRLCHFCHEKAHSSRRDGIDLLKALQRCGQAKYEETHSREDFIKRYGRSYL